MSHLQHHVLRRLIPFVAAIAMFATVATTAAHAEQQATTTITGNCNGVNQHTAFGAFFPNYNGSGLVHFQISDYCHNGGWGTWAGLFRHVGNSWPAYYTFDTTATTDQGSSKQHDLYIAPGSNVLLKVCERSPAAQLVNCHDNWGIA